MRFFVISVYFRFYFAFLYFDWILDVFSSFLVQYVFAFFALRNEVRCPTFHTMFVMSSLRDLGLWFVSTRWCEDDISYTVGQEKIDKYLRPCVLFGSPNPITSSCFTRKSLINTSHYFTSCEEEAAQTLVTWSASLLSWHVCAHIVSLYVICNTFCQW